MEVYDRIYEAVASVPKGQVRSYGQIALAIGKPRAARLVGWALSVLPDDTDIPWQRVINRRGILTIRNPRFATEHQKDLLEKEGVKVVACEEGWRVRDFL